MRPRYLPFLGLILFLTLVVGVAAASAPPDPRVERSLWAEISRQQRADTLILLDPAPDLSPAYRLPTKTARGRWVYDTLRTHALRTQAPLLAELDRRGIPHRRFWITNAVQARLDAGALRAVLALPGIQQIRSDAPFRAARPLPPSDSATSPATADQPETTPWGVQRVQAPWAWQQGYTGAGIVIAGQDTGYDWTHTALTQHYRGWDATTQTANHNYNWHDSIHADIPPAGNNPCGFDSPTPCDDGAHGTHTMGTMVGNDLDAANPAWPAGAAHAVGVAPGARWIGCRNMENGWGRPSTYIECFEWLTAPYPLGGNALTDGDPTRAPDIINNSWGCPPEEECTADRLAIMEPTVDAVDAAGIVVVVSAGNDGPSCGTVENPIAIYPRSFSIGATTNTGALASFSSRGPVTYNGRTYSKPNVSAPGVGVQSTTPGNSYGNLSGTSMAAPHTAGVIALLLDAEPRLRGDTDMIKAILQGSANPITSFTCGGADVDGSPNNLFGWGIVDARRAIESLAQSGFLAGSISGQGDQPLKGALITLFAQDGQEIAHTISDQQGAYSLQLPWGRYRLTVERTEYVPATIQPIYIVGGQTTIQRVALTLADTPTPTPTPTETPTATPTATLPPPNLLQMPLILR